MRPSDIQQIGEHLAIAWEGGGETVVSLENLRNACPCAACKGETDVMGHLHKAPSQPLRPESFRLKQLSSVGGYGLQPVWGDGHSSGIFTYSMLRDMASA